MDHGGRFHGTAVSQSGTGAVHPVWGERTGESGKDYQPVSGGGRTKRNCGAFNAKIHEVETKQDKEKALKETIERIKENSIDVRSRQSDPNDLTVVMQLINEQKELEKLKKTHISID